MASSTAGAARNLLRALSLLCFLCAPSLPAREAAAAGRDEIVVLTVRGPISPTVADYVERGVRAAEERGAALLVLELDTPGGLDASMRVITQAILNARVPVAVYVSPSGARAASAGAFVALAADVAAMAPGTTIGAAHPVSLFGKQDETSAQKATNDAAAYLRSIAERRGRNGDWAEKAVRQSASATEAEALREQAVDLVAADLEGLLAALDGRALRRPGGDVVLRTRGAAVARLPMDWQRRLLVLLADPNVAYLLLMIGLIGVFFELAHPGVIFPGVAGGISLILAFYALQALPVSAAGLLLIALAAVLFIAEVKVVSYGILGIGGAVSLLLGSMMLVRSPVPWLRVSLLVVLPMVALSVLCFLVVLRLVIRARRRPPATGAEAMVGVVGEVLEDLAPEGEVFVRGERWQARSPEFVGKGERVRVAAVRGLMLEVRRHREG